MSTLTPRLTPNNAIGSKSRSRHGTVFFQRFQCIRRTRWLKPAITTQPGTQHQAVSLDQSHQQGFGQVKQNL